MHVCLCVVYVSMCGWGWGSVGVGVGEGEDGGERYGGWDGRWVVDGNKGGREGDEGILSDGRDGEGREVGTRG